MTQKETWTFYFVYFFRGIAKHLTRYIRVKAHAIGVSILAFTLGRLFDFGEISGDKIQADASYLNMSISHCYVTIGGAVLLVQQLFIAVPTVSS